MQAERHFGFPSKLEHADGHTIAAHQREREETRDELFEAVSDRKSHPQSSRPGEHSMFPPRHSVTSLVPHLHGQLVSMMLLLVPVAQIDDSQFRNSGRTAAIGSSGEHQRALTLNCLV